MKRLNADYVKGIYFILSILVFLVLLSTVLRKELLGVCFGAVTLIALALFFSYKTKEKEAFCDSIYLYCLAGFLIGIGLLQISNIEGLRYTPSFDLDAIYGGAVQWVEEGSFADYYDYFDWFPNNLGGLCFLYVLFKIGSVFTSDYFLIAALGNEVFLLLTFTFISLSAKKLWGSRYGILAVFMCGCMLPFLFMTDVFYTDSLSLLFPVLLFYLSLKAEESDNGKKLWKWCIISGVTACLGIFIKSTVMIMVLAVGISLLMRKKWNVFFKYVICCFVICMAFTLVFRSYMYHAHLNPELARVKNTPYYHWIMMGLEGNGAYNPGDYEFTRSFTDPAERNDALKAEIKNRVSEKGFTGMVMLYKEKLFRCFGDGTLGLSDFLDDNPQNYGLLQQFLLYGGSKYPVYSSICNIVFYSLLILTFLYLLSKLRRGKKAILLPHGEDLAPALAMGGIIVFLMNWETSPRYITNYVPVIMLLALGGIHGSVNRLCEEKYDEIIKSFVNKYSKEIRIFCTAVCFRLVIYVLSVCIMAVLGDFTSEITFSDFLEAWKRWDSAHYINIAENGYMGAVENGEHIFLVFYPLYPWLMRTASLFISDFRLCGILLSVICYAAGCVFFYKIVEKEFNNKAAQDALLAISIFPFAFFFGSIATESLFFALSAGFFYYLGKHSWGKVAFFGFLACMTKVQGLLLAFSVLTELLYFKRGVRLLKRKDFKAFFKRIIYPGCIAATMLFGFAVYLIINYAVEGDPLRFMYYQKNHWGNSLCPIWETVAYIKSNVINSWFTSTGMSLWVPEFLLFFVYIIVILYGICRKMRPMYLIYLISFFLLTYSSTWLLSAGRYTINALPVFMLTGDFTSRHERCKMPVMMISAMIMMIYMIGYYQWKQIM